MEQHFPHLNLVGNMDEECIRKAKHLYSQGTDTDYENCE